MNNLKNKQKKIEKCSTHKIGLRTDVPEFDKRKECSIPAQLRRDGQKSIKVKNSSWLEVAIQLNTKKRITLKRAKAQESQKSR